MRGATDVQLAPKGRAGCFLSVTDPSEGDATEEEVGESNPIQFRIELRRLGAPVPPLPPPLPPPPPSLPPTPGTPRWRNGPSFRCS